MGEKSYRFCRYFGTASIGLNNNFHYDDALKFSVAFHSFIKINVFISLFLQEFTMRTIFLIEVIFSPFNYHPAVTLSYRTQSSDKRLFLEPSISGREEISDSSEERPDSISESSMALCDQSSRSEQT